MSDLPAVRTPDEAAFDLVCAKARAFADSAIVPEHFRGKPADCIVAMELAKMLDLPPYTVMSALYVVKGRASWSSQFMISRANTSGAFRTRIKFRVVDNGGTLAIKRRGDSATVPNLSVTAWAIDAETGEEVARTVAMSDAIQEGWTDNAKYSGRALGEQMLCYRAAALLIRTSCPEVMLGGMLSQDEADDLAVVDERGTVVQVARSSQSATAQLSALPDHGDLPDPLAGIRPDREGAIHVTIETTAEPGAHAAPIEEDRGPALQALHAARKAHQGALGKDAVKALVESAGCTWSERAGSTGGTAAQIEAAAKAIVAAAEKQAFDSADSGEDY